MFYFAYGTNLNPAVLAKKKVGFRSRQKATLRDYRLRFNKRSLRELLPDNIGFANIEPAPRERVEGALYEIDDDLESVLDRVERCPTQYLRVTLQVETEAGPHSCFAYRARPEFTSEELIPSRNYINHILVAGDLLTERYRQELEHIETYSGECAACHQVRTVLFKKEAGRMFVLCPSCLEAQSAWGAVRGRPFSVLDTEAVMQHVLRTGQGYDSIQALVADAIQRELVEP